jgi:hypothetical protein
LNPHGVLVPVLVLLRVSECIGMSDAALPPA